MGIKEYPTLQSVPEQKKINVIHWTLLRRSDPRFNSG